MADRMTDALTQQVLQTALRKPQTYQLLHHSDRGSQYTSADYQHMLARYHIQVSMSGTGNCYDNAPVESFFAQLKTEWVYQQRYPTRQAAWLSIFVDVEAFYNPHRLHSALDYRSPAQFEANSTQPLSAYLHVC